RGREPETRIAGGSTRGGGVWESQRALATSSIPQLLRPTPRTRLLTARYCMGDVRGERGERPSRRCDPERGLSSRRPVDLSPVHGGELGSGCGPGTGRGAPG